MTARKIVAGLFVSLDGVVEMEEESILPYFDDEVEEVVQSDQDEADTILLGRRTYEEFAAYWPGKTAADDPSADYINRTPKLVVSTTLKELEWENTTLIANGVVPELIKRRLEPGKDISMAGSPPWFARCSAKASSTSSGFCSSQSSSATGSVSLTTGPGRCPCGW